MVAEWIMRGGDVQTHWAPPRVGSCPILSLKMTRAFCICGMINAERKNSTFKGKKL